MAVLLDRTAFQQYTIRFWRTSLSSVSALRGAVQKVPFFPSPPWGKGGNVGTPHTPSRGCCPLKPCFVQLSKSPARMEVVLVDTINNRGIGARLCRGGIV